MFVVCGALRLRLSVVRAALLCVRRVFVRVIEFGARFCCVWCVSLLCVVRTLGS